MIITNNDAVNDGRCDDGGDDVHEGDIICTVIIMISMKWTDNYVPLYYHRHRDRRPIPSTHTGMIVTFHAMSNRTKCGSYQLSFFLFLFFLQGFFLSHLFDFPSLSFSFRLLGYGQ